MPAQLTPAQATDYAISRAQSSLPLVGWTDPLGQAWSVSLISVTAGDSQMMTKMRLRFDPVILVSLLPDSSRQAQEFDIAISARDTASGSISPTRWV